MKTLTTVVLLALVFTTIAAAGDLKSDLEALERGGWEAWGKGDGDYFRKYLTEDHVQVVAGASTMVGRETIAAEIAKHECKLESFDFTDVKVRRIDTDVAILSYKATQDSSCQGNKLPAKVYSTAVYVKKDGKWLSASYQETPID